MLPVCLPDADANALRACQEARHAPHVVLKHEMQALSLSCRHAGGDAPEA